jgi:WD40 repeat protein
MRWPNHADYADVIQYPVASFEDRSLRDSTAATNALGLPIAMSGNFASVYQLSNGRDRFAVRCFIRQVTNQKTRYARLENYLSPRDLPFMVPFEYISHGIRVNEAWYPIVKMDWVDGDPLHIFVERHLHQPAKIELLSINWRELIRTLEENDIGHGDLQHGNVLVSPDGELKLVDYDGMFVPSFASEKSPELGHPNYQHPLRNPDFYDERLDRFSALLIYLNLKAVSADPSLWHDFNVGDNLINSANDLRVPQSSELWGRLLKSPDEEVRKLTVFLTDFLKVEPLNIPDLETILESSIRGIVVPEHLDFVSGEDSQPLAKKAGAPSVTNTPANRQPHSLRSKGFEIAGWSALALALLSLLPPFRTAGSVATLIVAVASFTLPGPKLHHTRFVALLALVSALVLTLQDRGVEAVARKSSNSVSALHANAPTNTIVAETVAIEDPSETFAGAPDNTASSVPPIVISNSESQSISLPLSKPVEAKPVAPIATWNAHRQSVSDIAFTGDGRHIITTSHDKLLSIWRTLDQSLVHSISKQDRPVVSITTLTNAGIFATSDQAANLEWWSTDGGIPLKQIRFNENSLFPPTISRDGQLIAIGGEDRKSVSIHREGSPQISDTIRGFTSWVKGVHFSEDSRSMAVLSFDDTISIRESETGQILQVLEFPDAEVTELIRSPDGRLIAAAGQTGRIRIWETSSGNLAASVLPSDSSPRHICFTADSKWIIAAGETGPLQCIFAVNGFVRSPRIKVQSAITALERSPDGRWLATGTRRGHISIWKTADLLGEPHMEMAKP